MEKEKESKPVSRELNWNEYPIGTKAPAIGGGYWIRVEHGWKWCTGSTFPTPGGDNNGTVILPLFKTEAP